MRSLCPLKSQSKRSSSSAEFYVSAADRFTSLSVKVSEVRRLIFTPVGSLAFGWRKTSAFNFPTLSFQRPIVDFSRITKKRLKHKLNLRLIKFALECFALPKPLALPATSSGLMWISGCNTQIMFFFFVVFADVISTEKGLVALKVTSY